MRKPPDGCDSVNSGGAPVPGMTGIMTGMAGAGGMAAMAGGAGTATHRVVNSINQSVTVPGMIRGQQVMAASRSSAGMMRQTYYCHVVFDNNQAYPEYVITFRP
jgi:hypothetical protein